MSKHAGVVRFVGAADIPQGGRNTPEFSPFFPDGGQPVFASGRSEYHGQPLGLILATSIQVGKGGERGSKAGQEGG